MSSQAINNNKKYKVNIENKLEKYKLYPNLFSKYLLGIEKKITLIILYFKKINRIIKI